MKLNATIEELYTFILICDAGSISRAADQLSQTTSAVSRTLKRLEEKLNTTLLERTTRNQHLTHTGITFLPYAREIIAHLNEANDAIVETDSDYAGLIRLDSATPFILHILTPLIIAFMEIYPNIHIDLSNHEHMIDLLEKKIDIAIRIGTLDDSTLHAKLLTRTRLKLVASPAYLEKYGLPKNSADLKSHKTIGFMGYDTLNNWPIKEDNKFYTITPMLRATSGETVRAFAINGAGIAYLSAFLVNSDIEEGRLVSIMEDQLRAHYHDINAVYYQQNYLPKRIRLLLDFLGEALKGKYQS